jgi:23S rRNA (adenine1618-N6)-methyltransferase
VSCDAGFTRPSDIYCFQLRTANVDEAGRHVDATLSELPIKWIWKSNISTGVGFANRAVWSRALRRRASKGQDVGEEDGTSLGFKIQVRAGEPAGSGSRVTIRWLKGHDSVLFESFCGMMKRKLHDIK